MAIHVSGQIFALKELIDLENKFRPDNYKPQNVILARDRKSRPEI